MNNGVKFALKATPSATTELSLCGYQFTSLHQKPLIEGNRVYEGLFSRADGYVNMLLRIINPCDGTLAKGFMAFTAT